MKKRENIRPAGKLPAGRFSCVGMGKGMKAVCAMRMGTQDKGENLLLKSGNGKKWA